MAGKSKTVRIPGTVAASATGERYAVTSIDTGAFKGSRYLQQVNIGKQVQAIGKQAFQNCKKLKSIKGMAGLTQMGDRAFSGCTSLKKVALGKKVKKIGTRAFQGCKKLRQITVKSTALKAVGKQAIAGTAAKLTIKVPAKRLKSYKKLFGKKAGLRSTMKVRK